MADDPGQPFFVCTMIVREPFAGPRIGIASQSLEDLA